MGRSRLFNEAMALVILATLCLLLMAIVIKPSQPVASGWELPGNGSVDYIFIGSNDTLYAFRGNDIAAVRSDGSLAWTYTVPGDWSVLNNWSQAGNTIEARPVAAEATGHLYLVAVRHLTQEERDDIKYSPTPFFNGFRRTAVVMAISPDGNLEGEYTFTFGTPSTAVLSLLYDDTVMPYTIALAVRNGNVYLFKDYTEQIIDRDLREAKRIDDVASPAAIDEEGRIYVVRTISVSSTRDNPGIPLDARYTETIYRYYDGVLPTGIVEAYAPDRTLLWSRDIGYSSTRQELHDNAWDKYNSLPLYVNGTLYVPIRNGVVALDRDGNMKWKCQLPEDDTYSLFDMMPVDEHGNVYIRSYGVIPMDPNDILGSYFPTPQPELPEYLYVISPEGAVSRHEWIYGSYGAIFSQSIRLIPMAAGNGIIYTVNSTGAMDQDTFSWMWREDRLNPDTLMALDAMSGRELWRFIVPTEDKQFVKITADNLDDTLPGYTREMVDDLMKWEKYQGWRPDLGFLFHGHDGRISVYPGGEVTYLNYNFATFESPIIYGRSKCIYARSLYAIDETGRMLWRKPVDGLVTAMAANNSTFYYGTSDGRIGMATGNMIVTGLALTAAIYLFFRVFLVGAVSRARVRLNKNENRNAVLQFIADHPGVTAVDASRALKMNLGTVRYHLFILTANHRIITHKADGKFLRYFTNAGTYSEQERSLLSLMRREPLKRILKTLAERPGLSNLELARELEVSAASVHENVNELYDRGIVDRAQGSERGYAYVITEEYRPHVLRMMQRL